MEKLRARLQQFGEWFHKKFPNFFPEIGNELLGFILGIVILGFVVFLAASISPGSKSVEQKLSDERCLKVEQFHKELAAYTAIVEKTATEMRGFSGLSAETRSAFFKLDRAFRDARRKARTVLKAEGVAMK